VPPQVVNGGLIDFQDNFHRGVADYTAYMNAQQQHAALANGYLPAQPYQPQAMMQPYQAGMQALAAPGGQQLPCISGPPAYIHVNGQTYVPVDAQQPVASGHGASKPVVALPSQPPASETTAAASEAPRVYTEEDVERRAREKVEAWAASKLKQQHAAPETRKHLKGRSASSDLDRAVERISSVNAGMRGRFHSPF